jgi:hypothetical protein
MPPETLDTFVAPRYRSAGRRKEANNDRRAAADAPLAALRGFLSGVAGAPGDIEGLVRMLPGLNEETVLPTSDDVEKMLPLRSASATPWGRAATGAAQLGGGFYVGPGSPLRAIAAAPRAVSKASRDFAAAAGGSGSNVVKNRGGNWLAGSVEDALRGLKTNRPTHRDEALLLGGRWAQDADLPDAQRIMAQEGALNTWIDKQLTRYVKNDMATPEDPIRALAERGVLHVEPRQIGVDRYRAPAIRSEAGGKALGVSGTAKAWEDSADTSLLTNSAEMLANSPKNKMNNPWLEKVDPNTTIYRARDSTAEGLGFSHLIDELRNATNPQSGLPRELLLKYESLPQLSVPQAVERVAKINEWRAAQKVAADAARANNAATQVFKDYPDKGFKWVELRTADDAPEGWKQKPNGDWVMPDGQLTSKGPQERALEDALKYEGETMGHCVGGYCPDVLEGRSRIYSLRDAKGQPHVTVEVAPSQRTNVGRQDIPDRYFDEALGMLGGERPGLDDAKINDLALELYHMENPPAPELSRIVQIKGKANRAPNEEYLPYVQDFVKSGQWSDVGDLGNTGLVDIQEPNALLRALRDVSPERDIDKAIQRFNAAVESNPSAQRYMSTEELRNFLDDELLRNLGPDAPKGFATGGIVSSTDYDPSAVDAIVEQLRAEFA